MKNLVLFIWRYIKSKMLPIIAAKAAEAAINKLTHKPEIKMKKLQIFDITRCQPTETEEGYTFTMAATNKQTREDVLITLHTKEKPSEVVTIQETPRVSHPLPWKNNVSWKAAGNYLNETYEGFEVEEARYSDALKFEVKDEESERAAAEVFDKIEYFPGVTGKDVREIVEKYVPMSTVKKMGEELRELVKQKAVE